nr:glycosyltransferase [uncultured Niameybacter sp.]
MNYHFVNGIKSFSYMSSLNHEFLGDSKLKDTIGNEGSNLSLVILSLNRAYLTVTLLNSLKKYIPAFKGEIIIMDNGSTSDTISKLESFLASYTLSTQLIKLHANYGVAKGRNKSMDYIKTEWIMFLDNDIYFLDNPLPSIHQTLNQLGCHFLNLPLLDATEKRLYALGGHLAISHLTNCTHVECTSIYAPSSPVHTTMVEPFLSTFLFGGASVLKKSTFMQLGGFDENMFVGYEDIDFSIRIYNAGLKIGNCGHICLVHNHIIDNSNDIQSYESIRSSYDILTQSAIYLENKHNICVRNHTPASEPLIQTDVNNLSHAITIVLIVNTSDDYYYTIARQLKESLSPSFNIELIILSTLSNISDVLFLTQHAHLVHFFDYTSFLSLFSFTVERTLNSKGIDTVQYMDLLTKLAFSTGITDINSHTLLDIKNSISKLKYISYYYVTSETSKTTYTSILHVLPPPYVISTDTILESLKLYFISIFNTF